MNAYHLRTAHSWHSVRLGHGLDWHRQPRPYKFPADHSGNTEVFPPFSLQDAAGLREMFALGAGMTVRSTNFSPATT
ncbi:MAG: hypothetical protein BWK76_12625 [Desulfobulbaceae bacterium A2]|nr:MAG: hypothetical protein BWK76_12625 [Desulfobulbaceae bacterium A2]